MILFFDTETTGLPVAHLPPGDDLQPHLVQLAALLTEDDGTERASLSVIVNPGVPIPKAASDVHGITDDVAAKVGVSPKAAVQMFRLLASKATISVAHNRLFDAALMETASVRVGVENVFGASVGRCTMEVASPIVNLPPTAKMLAAGFNKPKPPRLEECIRHFFGEDLAGAHDALVDVRACARVFFHLRTLAGQVPS